MRIVQAGHFQLRKYGIPKVSTELKLHNGFIRLNHNVQIFSERDTAAFEAPFGFRDLGRSKANRRLVETCINFSPDLLVLGHCDIIQNRTLDQIRHHLPNILIAYRNVDALYVPANVSRIKSRAVHVDHIFLTTAGHEAKTLIDIPEKISYIPNPVDASYECFNCSKQPAQSFQRDLVFCGQGDPDLPRFEVIRKLKGKLNDQMKFETFGFDGESAVWGRHYDQIIASSKMGLNLNRKEGAYLSSSARVAQLMGNGLLTFIHEATGLQKFFQDKAVFFNSDSDLGEKLVHYHKHDSERRKVASAGHDYVHRFMSSERIADYMIKKTFKHSGLDQFAWTDC
jgi:hypothetical protein